MDGSTATEVAAPHRREGVRSGKIQLSWIPLLVLLTLLGPTGCLFARDQLNLADFRKRVTTVEPGRTTVEMLEERVGPPMSVTPIGGKRLLVYVFSDSKTATLNLIVFGSSKTNSGFDTALFLVNEDDVIERVSVTGNSEDLPWQFWAFGD